MLGSFRKVISGICAGTLATFVFQQGTLLALKHLNLAPEAQPWSMAPASPLPIPVIAMLALLGGFWGAVIALTWNDIPGESAIMRGIVGGLLGPGVIGAWTLLPWLQGQPMFAAGDVKSIALTAILCISYGLGTGLIIALLEKKKVEAPSRRRVLI